MGCDATISNRNDISRSFIHSFIPSSQNLVGLDDCTICIHQTNLRVSHNSMDFVHTVHNAHFHFHSEDRWIQISDSVRQTYAIWMKIFLRFLKNFHFEFHIKIKWNIANEHIHIFIPKCIRCGNLIVIHWCVHKSKRSCYYRINVRIKQNRTSIYFGSKISLIDSSIFKVDFNLMHSGNHWPFLSENNPLFKTFL